MAAFGFSSAQGGVKVAGIKSWKMIPSGSTGGIDLGKLFDGKATVSVLTQKDSMVRSIPFVAEVNLSAKMLSTHKTSVLEMLGSLVGPAIHEVELVNGLFLTSGVADTFGLGWKFDSTKDLDGMRFIEITAKGKVTLSSGTFTDLDDVFASTTAISTTPPGGGEPLEGWSAVGYEPAGMAYLQTRAAGETAWESLLPFRNGKLVCETVEYTDSHGRNIPFAVRFAVSVDWLQTNITALELMDRFSAESPDFNAVLFDGAVFTFADNCGVSWSYNSDTDMDGVAYTTISGDGIVLLSSFAGLVS